MNKSEFHCMGVHSENQRATFGAKKKNYSNAEVQKSTPVELPETGSKRELAPMNAKLCSNKKHDHTRNFLVPGFSLYNSCTSFSVLQLFLIHLDNVDA